MRQSQLRGMTGRIERGERELVRLGEREKEAPQACDSSVQRIQLVITRMGSQGNTWRRVIFQTTTTAAQPPKQSIKKVVPPRSSANNLLERILDNALCEAIRASAGELRRRGKVRKLE